jgi:hypothetical protein
MRAVTASHDNHGAVRLINATFPYEARSFPRWARAAPMRCSSQLMAQSRLDHHNLVDVRLLGATEVRTFSSPRRTTARTPLRAAGTFCRRILGRSALTHRVAGGFRPEQRNDQNRLLTQHAFLACVLDAVIDDERTLAWFIGMVGVPVEGPYAARRLLKVVSQHPE